MLYRNQGAWCFGLSIVRSCYDVASHFCCKKCYWLATSFQILLFLFNLSHGISSRTGFTQKIRLSLPEGILLYSKRKTLSILSRSTKVFSKLRNEHHSYNVPNRATHTIIYPIRSSPCGEIDILESVWVRVTSSTKHLNVTIFEAQGFGWYSFLDINRIPSIQLKLEFYTFTS